MSEFFFRLVISCFLVLVLDGCTPIENPLALTATAKQAENNVIATSVSAAYTQASLPTKTSLPTTTPDNRSDFQKCEEFGRGVRYVISGKGVQGVSLTWQNETGGINQGDYKVPFCQPYTKFKVNDFVYISAQIILPTSGAGSITCKIYQGNKIIAQGQARGFPSITTCEGSLSNSTPLQIIYNY